MKRQYRHRASSRHSTQHDWSGWQDDFEGHIYSDERDYQFRDKPEPLKPGIYAMLSSAGLPMGSVYTKHPSGQWTKSAGGGTWEPITMSDDGVRAAGFVRMVEEK